jgi:hypothetical protein
MTDSPPSRKLVNYAEKQIAHNRLHGTRNYLLWCQNFFTNLGLLSFIWHENHSLWITLCRTQVQVSMHERGRLSASREEVDLPISICHFGIYSARRVVAFTRFKLVPPSLTASSSSPPFQRRRVPTSEMGQETTSTVCTCAFKSVLLPWDRCNLHH